MHVRLRTFKVTANSAVRKVKKTTLALLGIELNMINKHFRKHSGRDLVRVALLLYTHFCAGQSKPLQSGDDLPSIWLHG